MQVLYKINCKYLILLGIIVHYFLDLLSYYDNIITIEELIKLKLKLKEIITMKEKVFWIRRGSRFIGGGNVYLYGSEGQFKKDYSLTSLCYQTFARTTGIKFKDGEVKKVLMTFKEL